jgi:hypothetical protein
MAFVIRKWPSDQDLYWRQVEPGTRSSSWVLGQEEATHFESEGEARDKAVEVEGEVIPVQSQDDPPKPATTTRIPVYVDGYFAGECGLEHGKWVGQIALDAEGLDLDPERAARSVISARIQILTGDDERPPAGEVRDIVKDQES